MIVEQTTDNPIPNYSIELENSMRKSQVKINRLINHIHMKYLVQFNKNNTIEVNLIMFIKPSNGSTKTCYDLTTTKIVDSNDLRN